MGYASGDGYAPAGNVPVTGTFVATGRSAVFSPRAGRGFNVEVRGTFVGSVQMERSFDGTNWTPMTAAGTQLYAWTAPASEQAQEDEVGPQYSLNCTAYTSGTVTYRISQ